MDDGNLDFPQEPVGEVLDFDQARQEREPTLPFVARRMPAAAPARDNSAAALVAYAVEQKLDITTLKELIAMKNAEEDRAAEREFGERFSKMQLDYEPVFKAKKGYLNSYATLDQILAVYAPILAKHGFSYRFAEERLDEEGKKDWKRIWCHVSGFGHTKSTYFDTPLLPMLGKNEKGEQKGANEIQNQGIQSSYGQRYAFKACVGVITTDEDTDGNFTFENGVQYSQEISLMREAQTIEELVAAYRMAWKDKPESVKKMLYQIRVDLEKKFKTQGAS